MTMDTISCMRCDKQLRNVFDGENQPSAGLAFQSHGHYGSTSFDPMDGTFLEINICDDCLRDRAKAGRVLFGRDSRMLVTPGHCLLGWTETSRPLTPWDPAVESGEDQIVVENFEEWIMILHDYRVRTKHNAEMIRKIFEEELRP